MKLKCTIYLILINVVFGPLYVISSSTLSETFSFILMLLSVGLVAEFAQNATEQEEQTEEL